MPFLIFYVWKKKKGKLCVLILITLFYQWSALLLLTEIAILLVATRIYYILHCLQEDHNRNSVNETETPCKKKKQTNKP